MHSMTIYFCWLCDKPVELQVYTDTHYEKGYTVNFCSPEHYSEYQELKAL